MIYQTGQKWQENQVYRRHKMITAHLSVANTQNQGLQHSCAGRWSARMSVRGIEYAPRVSAIHRLEPEGTAVTVHIHGWQACSLPQGDMWRGSLLGPFSVAWAACLPRCRWAACLPRCRTRRKQRNCTQRPSPTSEAARPGNKRLVVIGLRRIATIITSRRGCGPMLVPLKG